MNPVIRWFHQMGSPPIFHRFADRWSRWLLLAALPFLAWGAWSGLFEVPADYQQGDSYRILFIHVPSAWMSLFIYGLMAVYAFIALVWRIKICEQLAMACAPIGAGFTAITLLTGSLWGRPMWGTWWTWDPRLTSELVLLFLFLGVIGLNAAIEDRRAAARAAGFLALIGASTAFAQDEGPTAMDGLFTANNVWISLASNASSQIATSSIKPVATRSVKTQHSEPKVIGPSAVLIGVLFVLGFVS